MFQQLSERETFIMSVFGETGVGKTYAILHELQAYQKHIANTQRRGYIFDTNNEKDYAELYPEAIKIEEIGTATDRAGSIKRVLPINKEGHVMDDAEQREAAAYMARKCRNCLIVFDDVDNYYRGSKGREISKLYTSYRHRSQDVIITHQSPAPMQPIEWQSAHILRMHKCVDEVEVIRDRVPNFELLKIAQLLVNEQYDVAAQAFEQGLINEDNFKKRSSFFVYVDIRRHKIMGAYSKEAFLRNALRYVNINRGMAETYYQANKNVKGLTRENAPQYIAHLLARRYFLGKQAE